MLINWFTVGAQALNFLLLVWLMKRFLYKPILHAIDEREKQIAAELANADKVKAEAGKESDEFKRKNSEFDAQRTALLKKAADEAEVERKRLFEEGKVSADALNAKRLETFRNDARQLNEAVSRQTRNEIFAVTRKTLLELAGTGLEERMCEVFVSRLREMEGGAKERLAGVLKTAADTATVRSAFDLSSGQQAAIQNALNVSFSTNTPLRFETVPDLISGVEFTVQGQKVAWCISDYLGTFEKSVEELLKGKDKPEIEARLPSGAPTT